MNFSGRINLLTGASLLLLGALGTRLYALTVSNHSDLRRKAEQRRRRAEVLPARRGPISDRQGRPLAVDRPTHRIGLDLPALDPALEVVTPLSWCLRITRPEALRIVREARARAKDTEEETLSLARVPLDQSERVHRILRRKPYLWARVDWDGVTIVTRTDLLRVRGEALVKLSELLDLDADMLSERIMDRVDAIHAIDDRDERIPKWREPLALIEAAPLPLVMRVSERAFELPGLRVEQAFARRYPHGSVAGHVLGYLGAPSAAEARRDRLAGVVLDAGRDYLGLLHGESDGIDARVRLRSEPYGRIGAERTFDAELRGVPGVRVVIRDVKNRLREEVSHVPPSDGDEVRLSLDVEVQAAVEGALDRALGNHGDASAGGAAVLIDLSDGGILTLASGPRFDANTLRETKYYEGLVRDPRRPLFHRAVKAYPPASTMKVLSAFAMFDPARETSLEPGWTTTCLGRLSRKARRFHCDGTHYDTHLVKALCKSCNVYFFRGADSIGLAPLTEWARLIGIGDRMATDVYGESRGLFPYEGFKRDRAAEATQSLATWSVKLSRAMNDPQRAEALELAYRRLVRAVWWQQACAQDSVLGPGDVRNAIIGQGDVQLTPLQVASIAAMVATDGRFPLPKLRLDDETRWRSVSLDSDVLAEVKQGMRQVVTEGTASARSIGLRDYDVAGKTGTAERGKGEPYLAWFMGYYPASRPEVAFAVLVDRTRGHGGGVCGPIARQMLEAYELSRGGKLR